MNRYDDIIEEYDLDYTEDTENLEFNINQPFNHAEITIKLIRCSNKKGCIWIPVQGKVGFYSHKGRRILYEYVTSKNLEEVVDTLIELGLYKDDKFRYYAEEDEEYRDLARECGYNPYGESLF